MVVVIIVVAAVRVAMMSATVLEHEDTHQVDDESQNCGVFEEGRIGCR